MKKKSYSIQVFRILVILMTAFSLLATPRTASSSSYVYQEFFNSYSYKGNTRDADWNIGQGVLSLLPQDTMEQSRPVVAALPGQGSYVAWEDERDGGTSIYIQHLDSYGNRLWPNDVRVSYPTYSGWESDPELEADQEGGAVVVWTAENSGTTKVLAQRITPAGTKAWAADLLLADGASSDQEYPDIEPDGAGAFFVAWADKRAGQINIYAQKVSISGQRLFLQDTQVSQVHLGKFQYHVRLATDYAGGVYVGWEDVYGMTFEGFTGEAIDRTDIYLNMVNAAGVRQFGSDQKISGAQPAWNQTLAVSTDGGGGVWILWMPYNYSYATGVRITPDAGSMKGSSLNVLARINAGEDDQVQRQDVNPFHMKVVGPDPLGLAPDFSGGVYISMTESSDISIYRIDGNGNDFWGSKKVPYNDPSGSKQKTSALSSDGVSGAWVVWEDMRRVNGDVYVQRIDNAGSPIWQNEIRANWDSGAASRNTPDIDMDNEGNAWLAWADTRHGYYKTYLQEINPSGQSVYADTRSVTDWSTNSNIDEYTPDIGVTSSGNPLVAWWDDRYAENIYNQVFDSLGNQVNSSEKRVNEPTPQASYPSAVGDGTGGYFIAWEDNRNNILDIFAQHLDGNGNPLWAQDIQVTDLDRIYYDRMGDNPEIIPDGNGGAFVAWWDNRASYADVYVQHLSSTGSRLWATDMRASSVLNSNPTQLIMLTFWRPGLALDGSGGVLVGWNDSRSGLSDLYIQDLSSTGQRNWANEKRVSSSTSPIGRTSLRMAGRSGSAWITWVECGDTNDCDIYLQKVSQSGTRLWAQDVRVGEPLGQDQYQPAVAVDPNGYASVAWVDRRNKTHDIYVQRFNPSGQAVWAQDTAVVQTTKFYAETGQAISKKINAGSPPILQATLYPVFTSFKGSLEFYLSNNGGVTWQTAPAGEPVVFSAAGNDLRWRVDLHADPSTVDSPIVDSLRVEYDTQLPVQGDTYETDDTCTSAKTLQVNSRGQSHNFHNDTDVDWTVAQITTGVDYIIQTTETQQNADTSLEFYQSCSGSPTATEDNAYGNDVVLKFTASYTGSLYIKVANAITQANGNLTGYKLSIRTALQSPIAVIVAGHNDANTLQTNINYSADLAYMTFLRAGVPKTRIRYLGANSARDVDGNGFNDDVFGSATLTNVQEAIENWPATLNIGPGVPFFVYLVDHGHYDSFLSNGNGSVVSASDLDLWLTNLEAKNQVDKVNVIIEACKSGSFIDITTQGPAKVSKNNRVIIASTTSGENAYASPKGAYFSDAFWTALGQNEDMLAAYQTGLSTVGANALQQHPWLDDNGDSVANNSDGAVARLRGLNASFSDYAPIIDIAQIQNGPTSTQITVQARDDFDPPVVSLVVYKPSFVEPLPTSQPTTPVLDVTSYTLSPSGGNSYSISLPVLSEIGAYRFIFYATDSELKRSDPYVVYIFTGNVLYLPLVHK